MPAECPWDSAVISNSLSPESNVTELPTAGSARFQQPLLALSHTFISDVAVQHQSFPSSSSSSSLSQATSAELQAEGREERAPRRCVRLLESCLGQQIPCCDPCATCYCRFFNAVCYCRKISTASSCGKN